MLKKLDQNRPDKKVSVNTSVYNPNERVLGAVLAASTVPYGTVLTTALDPKDSSDCNASTIKYTPALGTLLQMGLNSIKFYCDSRDPVWFNPINDSFDVSVIKYKPSPQWADTNPTVNQGATISAAMMAVKVPDLNGTDITSQGLLSFTYDGAPISAGASAGAVGTHNLVFRWIPSGTAGSQYEEVTGTHQIKVLASGQTAAAKAKTTSPAVTTKAAAKPVTATTAAPVTAPASPVPAATENAIEIKDLWLDSVDKTSAVLVWKTNKPTKSEVQYGPTDAYGSIESDASLVSDHRIALKGSSLKAGTLYHAKVLATDEKGTVASSPDFTFTTNGYNVTLKMIGKDGKPVPAGIAVKLGDQEGKTDAQGNVSFNNVGPGTQQVTYVLGAKTVSAAPVSVAETDSLQEISVKTTYGSGGSSSGLLIILLLALLLIPLVLFLLWFLKKRSAGDDSGYGGGGGSQDYFATYGQPVVPSTPAAPTGSDWQQQAVGQVPPAVIPPAPGADNHNFPWAK